MRKTAVVLGLTLGLLLCHAVPVSAQVPDAVIELSGASVAAGVGSSWGSGTLIFQGKRYPLKTSGFTLASVGVVEYAAVGSVTGLKRVPDIDGVYTAVPAGTTVAGGTSTTAIENQNGVTIQMTSTTEGVSLMPATEGVRIVLAQ
jgi:hypothetical protein